MERPLLTGRPIAWLVAATLALASSNAVWAQGTNVPLNVRIEVPANVSTAVAKSIADITDRLGKISTRIHATSTVANANPGDILSDVRAGKVQVALVPTAALPSVVPGFKVYDSLFVFNGLKDVESFQTSTLGGQLLQQLTPAGLVGLTYLHDGLVQIASARDISNPDDLKGLSLSLRAAPDSFTANQFAALGTAVKATSSKDPLQEIESGRADATELTWSELMQNVDRVKGRQVVPTNHRYRGYVLVANKDFLDHLSSDDRRKFLSTIKEGSKRQNEAASKIEFQAKASGMWTMNAAQLAGAATTNPSVRGTLSPVWLRPDAPSTVFYAPSIAAYGTTVSAKDFASILASAYSASGASDKPASAQAKATDTFWNAWMSQNGRPVDELVGDSVYVATLDLSAYAYTTKGSTVTSGNLSDVIASAIKNKLSVRLTIRAFLLTDGLEFDTDAMREQKLGVDMSALSRATKADLRQQDAAALKQMLGQKATEADLSKRFSAGSIAVPVIAKKTTGCTQIAFSIWNETGSMPLDHVVLSTPLKASSGDLLSPNTCPFPKVQGSFGSLAGGVAPDSPVDAALHLFQYQSTAGRSVTFAIYVDIAQYKASSAEAKFEDRGVYTWSLQSDLAYYVGTQLPPAVKAAREKSDYSEVAVELRRKIFPFAEADKTPGGARSAFQSLNNLPTTGDQRPTLLVRALTAQGRHVYAPLAMLSVAKGAAKFKVVYPLPRENYSESVCVAQWAVGYPKSLSGLHDEDLMLDDSKELDSTRMRRLHDLTELQSYLNPPAAKDSDSPVASAASGAEALLLLAHQGDGYFWFEGDGNSAQRIPIESNNRSFPPGSVAFLSACSGANPKGDNQAVVEKFNQNGVDAMVVSPFPVTPEYGRLLALSAMRLVRAAYQHRTPLTVAELFALAADEAAKNPDNDVGSDRSLEFVILGNPILRLCQPAGK